MALKKIFFVLLLIIVSSIFIQSYLPQLSACIRCDLLAQMNETELTPPRILYRAPLYYPYELQDELIMGTVILNVTILPDSTIGYIEIEESIPELDSLAIANIMEWEFAPAYRGEEPDIGILTVEISFIPEFLMTETTPVDTIAVDLDKLQERIDRVVAKEQEPINQGLNRINLPFYCENYHVISWESSFPYITREHFTFIPSYTLSSHLLQNYYPFYEFDRTEYRWSFYTDDYLLPVTFVEAYAGLGYLNMDFAQVNLAKNNMFRVENLQVRMGMLFQEGYWMGANERSTNFALTLKYLFGNQALLWNSNIVNQEIPPVKFINQQTLIINEYYEEKINDHSIYWQNPYLNAGVRYEETRFRRTPEEEQPDRTIYQLLINRSFPWHKHNFSIGWEYFIFDETPGFSGPYLIEDHPDIKKAAYSFEGERIDFGINLYTGLGFKHHIDSDFGFRFNDYLVWEAGVLEADPRTVAHHGVRTVIKRDLHTTLGFHTSWGEFKAGFGQRDYWQMGLTYYSLERSLTVLNDNPQNRLVLENELTTPYLISEYKLTRSMGATDWLFSGFFRANVHSELDYFPQWYGKTNLECRYNLKHQNAITAGLIYLHTDRYYTINGEVPASEVLDGYVRITITKLFDIQADAKNILQTDSVFGYPVAGLHWNLGIRWFFFN